MYSLTQAGNLGVFAGIIVLVAKQFHVQLAQDTIVQLLGDIVTIVGLVTSWYGRYRQGDLTVAGFRK